MPREREVTVRPVMVHLICDCGGEMKCHGGGFSVSEKADIPHRCTLCGFIDHTKDIYPYLKHVGESNGLHAFICTKDSKGRCVRPAPWPKELVEVSPNLNKWACTVCRREVVPPEQATREPRGCKDHPNAHLKMGTNVGVWLCAVCGSTIQG